MLFDDKYGLNGNDQLEHVCCSWGDDLTDMIIDCREDSISFWNRYSEELTTIIETYEGETKFNLLYDFLKRKDVFDFLLEQIESGIPVVLWRINLCYTTTFIKMFNSSKEDLYKYYLKLLDRISNGQFNYTFFSNFYGEFKDDYYGDVEECVTQIDLLPNGWLVCEFENVWPDDATYSRHLFLDEDLVDMGDICVEGFADDIEEIYRKFIGSGFNKRKLLKLEELQRNHEEKDVQSKDISYEANMLLIPLYVKQITRLLNTITQSKESIAKKSERLKDIYYEIMVQLLEKHAIIKKSNICLNSSIRNDICNDNFSVQDLFSEIESELNIKVPENEIDAIKTFKDLINAMYNHTKRI